MLKNRWASFIDSNYSFKFHTKGHPPTGMVTKSGRWPLKLKMTATVTGPPDVGGTQPADTTSSTGKHHVSVILTSTGMSDFTSVEHLHQ